LIPSRKFAALLLATLAGAAATVYSIRAQTDGQPANPAPVQAPAAGQMNHTLVVIDPAHGGPDSGATLGDGVLEKDLTLKLAAKLRAALTAAGFTVVATRDGEISNLLTADDRAEVANRAHAVACLVLHATATGSGVHVYTSTLTPSDSPAETDSESPPAYVPVPWELAQAGSVRQSLRLADDLNAALTAGNLPASAGRAAVRPLDNLMCPAVAIEVAPLAVPGSDTTPVTDADYQKRVVDALAAALKTWRTHTDPAPDGAVETAPASRTSTAVRAIAAAEAAGRAATRGAQ
jgi:N-acetylmuramoyl-L-alanine amidase